MCTAKTADDVDLLQRRYYYIIIVYFYNRRETLGRGADVVSVSAVSGYRARFDRDTLSSCTGVRVRSPTASIGRWIAFGAYIIVFRIRTLYRILLAFAFRGLTREHAMTAWCACGGRDARTTSGLVLYHYNI